MKNKPTYDELARRVSELERRIKELEAQPREQHFHYHPPIYQQPYAPPVLPEPYKIVIGDPSPYQTTTITWPDTASWASGLGQLSLERPGSQ